MKIPFFCHVFKLVLDYVHETEFRAFHMNWITVAIYACVPNILGEFDLPIRLSFTKKRPPSFNPLIEKCTSIHKALIPCEGINAIPSEKALNSSNIAVLCTFIGADNPRSTSHLFYTVTIVLRCDAGIIVSDTGLKLQNAATVSIFAPWIQKNRRILAYLYAKWNLVPGHSTS